MDTPASGLFSLNSRVLGCLGPLHLHIHDVRIGLYHAVANMQRGLKADLRFLDGDHGFFQADFGVLHLHFTLQPA